MFLWIKVLHILAIISWMAGLFYLPRLFVYHATAVVGSETDTQFKIMERRLMAAIMRPAAVVGLISGIFLVSTGGFNWGDTWLSIKLLGVLLLVVFHGLLEKHLEDFALSKRLNSSRYFRIINEVPTLLLILIVIMVVVKPF